MISLHPLRRLRRIAAPLSIAILAAGCGGGDGPTPPPPQPALPAAIAPTSGSGQQGAAGLALPIPLVARVTDAQGRPLAGVNVTWQVTAGGGTITPTSAATDAAGEARAQWTLGTTAGANAATATIAGLAAAQFTATGIAGPAAAVVATPEAVTLEVGGTQQLAATARDAFGNAIANAAFQWSVVEGTAATVDANGTVRATAVGTARVAASANGRADTVVVTVQAASTLRLSTVSGGGVASCGLDAAGVPYCWGANSARQLGRPPVGNDCQGNGDCSLVPVTAQTSERFTTVSAGRDGACAVTADGRLFCWGRVTRDIVSLPTLIGPNVVSVGVGDGFYCFVESGGQATCRGINDEGQLGNGGPRESAGGPVVGGIAFASVDAGTRHACGLTAAGAAYCWGLNDRGQLGAPTSEFCNGLACSRSPVAVAGGHAFRAITAGREFTCGITTAGAALCWGVNYTGQLGAGSTAPSVPTPAPVAGGLTFAQIDASGISELAGHACGVTTAGEGYCWGANARGELGVTQDLPLCSTPSGSYFCTRAPLRVASPPQATTWRVISAGMTHSCGVTTGNRAYCWGENTFGQVGDGTRVNRPTPVAVADPR